MRILSWLPSARVGLFFSALRWLSVANSCACFRRFSRDIGCVASRKSWLLPRLPGLRRPILRLPGLFRPGLLLPGLRLLGEVSLCEYWLFREVVSPFTVAISSPLLAFSFIRSNLNFPLGLLRREELGRFFRRLRFPPWLLSWDRLLAIGIFSLLDLISSLPLVWLRTKTWCTLPWASVRCVLLEATWLLPMAIPAVPFLSSYWIMSSSPLCTFPTEASCSSVGVCCNCSKWPETKTTLLLLLAWLPYLDLAKLSVIWGLWIWSIECNLLLSCVLFMSWLWELVPLRIF